MTINYYDVDEDGQYYMASKTMPAATGMMTAYNRVGATYSGASLSINGILRDECGYTGTTVTDAGGQPNTYMTTDFMIRRGGSLTLANNGTNGLYDTESATAVYWIKDAAKHILYNKANSNCVVGLAPGDSITYTLAPWRLGLYIAWGVVGALVLADGIVIGLIAADKIRIKEKVKKEEEESGSEF